MHMFVQTLFHHMVNVHVNVADDHGDSIRMTHHFWHSDLDAISSMTNTYQTRCQLGRCMEAL